MSKSTITLNDIAEKLGISKVAVSKALRYHEDISGELKQSVHDTAAQMGYIPNHFARSLSGKESNTIGLLIPRLAHHFFATCIEAIYTAAYANVYDIIMTVSHENPENKKQHIQTLVILNII